MEVLINMNRIPLLLIIISISSLIILNFNGAAAANATATANANPPPRAQTKPKPVQALVRRLNPAIKKICDGTEYPAVCATSVVPYQNMINGGGKGKIDRASVLVMQAHAAIQATQRAIQIAKRALMSSPPLTIYVSARVKNCVEYYEYAIDAWKKMLGFVKARQEFEVATQLNGIGAYIMSCESSFEEDHQFNASTPVAQIDGLIINMISNVLSLCD